VRLTAAVFLNSIVPVQLLVRGQSLDTDAPSYYAVSVTRGTELQLLKVVDGVATVLATVSSQQWVSNEWVYITLTAEGDELHVQAYRPGTAESLAADGSWQSQATDAIVGSDGTLSAGGFAGLGRPAVYSGAVLFDKIAVTPLGGNPPGAGHGQPPPPDDG